MEARNLQFSYDDREFISDINLKIKRGQITTILGPNGSGKSTLLNLFARQLFQKQGDIIINGKNIKTMSSKIFAKELAIVYQQNSAPNDLTVEKLVSYGRTPYKNFWNSESEEDGNIIEWAMKATKLLPLKNKPVGQISGGERQRAFIAMALAQKTDILFLDEPTTYLDVYYQLEILELVKELNESLGITIVMVLHDINQALQYSDNIIIMKSGKVIYDGIASEAITENRIKEVYGINSIIRWCPVNCCKYMTPIQRKERGCETCPQFNR